MPHGPTDPNRLPSSFAAVAVTAALLLPPLLALGGCATQPRSDAPPATTPAYDPHVAWTTDPRTLVMFDGATGARVTWDDVRARIADADIILLGETHDHTLTHRLQAVVVDETLVTYPGSAVAMEMLERDHQQAVDAYLAGSIDLATFIERVGGRRWEYEYVPGGTWENHYQPMIDSAKRTNSRVIAANAPRTYVRLARTDGFDALLRLPPEQQAYFDVPLVVNDGDYRRRFDNTMAGLPGVAPEINRANDGVFRSQQTWDATMATSVVRAWNAGATKVLLAVGAFHVNWKGGIYEQIRQHAPGANIVVITVVPRWSEVLEEDIAGAGDVVVYAGPSAKRPGDTE
ncbi:MAG: ChaN family lipoprotein [Phycisphaerae bacterium]|nr:ChaN family lipoprotein [Phycisphaerae bacterium]